MSWDWGTFAPGKGMGTGTGTGCLRQSEPGPSGVRTRSDPVACVSANENGENGDDNAAAAIQASETK
jgi:hypothetical protein